MKKLIRPSVLTFAIFVFLSFSLQTKAEFDDNSLWKGLSLSCVNDENDKNEITNSSSLACHSIRLVRKIVQKMLENARRKKTLDVMDGVSLVENEDIKNSGARSARVFKSFGPIGSALNFLETREIRIKLNSLLPDNLESIANGTNLISTDEGRGKKKGDNGMMMMVVMMGKMMAAMGFGALGLLAMKALMVSSIALMLSLLVSAKKLASKEEDNHRIIYAQDHHRRKRYLLSMADGFNNEPYRGYK